MEEYTEQRMARMMNRNLTQIDELLRLSRTAVNGAEVEKELLHREMNDKMVEQEEAIEELNNSLMLCCIYLKNIKKFDLFMRGKTMSEPLCIISNIFYQQKHPDACIEWEDAKIVKYGFLDEIKKLEEMYSPMEEALEQ